MKKIILVGYMGVGKTTIAKLLSQKTGFKVVDTDALIEKQTELSISDIFKQKGEIHFRKLEHEVFKQLIEDKEELIISTGGGTPCYAHNHLFLNGDQVVSVYLYASIDTLFQRLKNENSERPLVAGQSEEELKEFIAKNLFDRSYFYNQATHKVMIDAKTPQEITEEILGLLH
ncbi:MAG: shikimate kinase [Flavobacterium sp.]